MQQFKNRKMFQLPWVCASPCSVHEPAVLEEPRKEGVDKIQKVDRNRCQNSKKIKKFSKQEENQPKRRGHGGGWLGQEMSAREQAQTFVAMSGFPMPFLP
eukprot:Skav219871  [mRNA]  locus=scaffold777:174509:175733:+ [translate_table: standard]